MPPKRSKGHYVKSAKRRKPDVTVTGLESLKQSTQGVLVTANFLKGGCKREVQFLLEEFSGNRGNRGGNHGNQGKTGDDVTEELAAEIAALKKEKRVFDRMELSNNMMFVAIRDGNIVSTDLVHSLLTSLKEGKQRRTRFTQKLMPVSHTCYASVEEIGKTAQTMLAGVFHNDTPKTFSVVYKARNNSSLSRDDVIKSVATVATDNDKWKDTVKVHLDNPEWAVVVNVFQTIAFLSLLKDFNLLAKYNIDNLTAEWKEPEKEDQGDEVVKGGDEVAKEVENVVKEAENVVKEGNELLKEVDEVVKEAENVMKQADGEVEEVGNSDEGSKEEKEETVKNGESDITAEKLAGGKETASSSDGLIAES